MGSILKFGVELGLEKVSYDQGCGIPYTTSLLFFVIS